MAGTATSPGFVFRIVIKTTDPAGCLESSAYSNLNLDIANPKKITAITISIPTSLLQSPLSPDRNAAGHKNPGRATC